ncbi:alpha/beta hydrolase [Massilia sp. Root351]|jgi:predicted alpha/beta hydrolase family esterase|uniref:RBBP9/YdeN family alpha/beta hydrolase n=1 Tax=Massilia sp. Root351 TaxID=1736522 RepID=UPI00070DCD18|nr:alpha/beta hydrolase [Massilia sp. Root351]KQV82211.1 alpha/beta hydrolase [Massilia sp. Root351]
MTKEKAVLLIVPGLRDHVREHWQSLLQQQVAGARSVPPLTENALCLQARVEAISAQLAQIDGPVVLVAHSAGVLMVVHWAARHGSAGGKVRGALLATPPDLGADWPAKYPSPATLAEQGWSPLPMQPLPFPCIVAASSNDPLARLDAVREMAAAWGGELVALGEAGHLNPASGYGPWPRARELVARLS